MKTLVLGFVLLAASLIPCGLFAGDDSTGTLVFTVRNYETEVKLKKKIESQLEHGGVEWGVQENELIVTLISKAYVGVDLPHLTRYGREQSLELPVGDYGITCIGLSLSGGARSVERLLDESAFLNRDVVGFSVRPGEVTRIDVFPVIEKHKAGLFMKLFVPRLELTVSENGQPIDNAVISERIATSIPWGRYSGPLKD